MTVSRSVSRRQRRPTLQESLTVKPKKLIAEAKRSLRLSWRNSHWYNSPATTKLLVVMAVIMFVTGMSVSIRTYILNNQAISQVEALAGQNELQLDSTANDSSASASMSSSVDFVPSQEPITMAEYQAYAVAADLPRYITIPSIGVQTIVKHAGLDQSGAIAVPRSVFETNWYNGGAKPSDVAGAMLITGHYSGPRGVGIFHDLNKLNDGDVIDIEQGDGTIIRFKVVEKIIYELVNVEMAKVITSADPAKLGLNLMTCEGRFDRQTKTYDHRLLIRAVKES